MELFLFIIEMCKNNKKKKKVIQSAKGNGRIHGEWILQILQGSFQK